MAKVGKGGEMGFGWDKIYTTYIGRFLGSEKIFPTDFGGLSQKIGDYSIYT